MGAGNRISMLCLGEAIGHGLYDWILQRTETAQTQRWIAAECGREGLLENSKDGGLKHLTTTNLTNWPCDCQSSFLINDIPIVVIYLIRGN